ncbi:hypothetical protein VPH35_014611 [Triticum aestivum]
MEVWLKLVTTTSSWRQRKTRHEGQKMVWNVVVIVRALLRNKEKGACRTQEGLPVRYWRKVGMTSSPHGPYGLGHTHATLAMKMGSKAIRRSESGKIASSDCSLQLGNMKLKSLVIVDQHAAVNMYPGPVHTARHTLGIGFARSIGPMITHDFCVPLVSQRPLVVLLAHTMVGSSTGVKS